MYKKVLFFLSVFFTICPFILLLIFFETIPSAFPVFLDIEGNPILNTEKSLLIVFRLPLMGVITHAICFIMFSLNVPIAKDKNQSLWLWISLLASLKMALTSI